jgi:bifunctional non-homologous end joining protein LigD
MVVFVLKTGLKTGLNTGLNTVLNTQAGGFGVFYQMRSLALHSAPNPEMHQCLLQYGNEYGGVILDGELWWEDVQGGEHRTAAQAQTANEDAGQPEVRPRWRYSIFTALYSEIAGGSTAGDLAAGDLTAKQAEVRILLCDTIGSRLAKRCSNFEVAPTAKTMSDKALLAAKQQAQGREGEVWYRVDAPYTGGKTNGSQEPIVRTKYTVELSVVVLNLTPTDKARPFGAIEVGVYDRDAVRPIGSVGTGFTQAQMVEIARRHQTAKATGQPLAIAITSRRFTEGWQVWHASFDGFSDRSPQACTFAQLTGAQLTGAQLTGAQLTGAQLTGAQLTGAQLTGAQLTGAQLTGAQLTGAQLTGAQLTGAQLTGAQLTGAQLTGAQLTGKKE